jgi:allantoinase
MKSTEFAIRSRRVVFSDGMRPATLHVRNGRIQRVLRYEKCPVNTLLENFGDLVVMPGLVDTHVHINEPGRAEWEGFESATRAAAAGGITTLIEMPLNSVPATTTVGAFSKKLSAARGKLSVDVGFWGGVVPGNTDELRPLHRAGVFGFKCFLVPSGVPEFEHVTEKHLRQALPTLKKLNTLLLAHAEIPGPIEKELRHLRDADPSRYRTWLLSRPALAEAGAIQLLIRLCREYGVRTHIVHLSAMQGIALVRRARRQGLPITVETCPHYLTFTAEEIPDRATVIKCAPPVRERKNREALWAGLEKREIELVVTDHSPCPPAMKCRESGDFLRAWGGIASLELSLPVMWTNARERGIGMESVVEWMCDAPARLAGLSRKGRLAAGCDADFVVFDPHEKWIVQARKLHQRHKLTPYDGRELCGRVKKTFLRGQLVYDDGVFPFERRGQILKRGTP